MPAAGIFCAASQQPICMADEYTIKSDYVLNDVSAMTANLKVTIALYPPNEVGKVYPLEEAYVSFDNLSLKVCMYQISDIEKVHTFGEAVDSAGRRSDSARGADMLGWKDQFIRQQSCRVSRKMWTGNGRCGAGTEQEQEQLWLL